MEEVKRKGLNNVLNLSFSVVVTAEDIDDIMVSALEGGITHWANRAKVPEEKRAAEWGHEQIARDGELHIHVVEPFDQDDTEWYILTKEKFLNGLAKYLKEPKYSDCLEFAVSIGIGIATKSGKFLETWAKAYTEEFSSSMAEALESVVSELEFEKQEEVTVEPEQNNRSEIHEEMIRLETERDIYKSLYMNLLSDLSGGRLS